MINLGILGCADIAFKRFIPAAGKVDGLKAVAVAEEYAPEKLGMFRNAFSLAGYERFDDILARDDIQAVYVPQPPALHYRWAKKALESGKHVLVEKPSTTSYADTEALTELAAQKGLALHENYMFRYHSQLGEILGMIRDGRVGEVRLYKASFGFPLRGVNDFRYNRALGGGALLDAGGYTAKLASCLLGESIRVETAALSSKPGYEVDMYGSATFSDGVGAVCQVSFGMDCAYQCCLEVWGSTGRLYTNRIFTAPDGYEPRVLIETASGTETVILKADSHFQHSIESFVGQIIDADARKASYAEMLIQARLVEDMRRLAERG